MALGLTIASIFLTASAAGSPALVEQLPVDPPRDHKGSAADILISPIPYGHTSSRETNETAADAESALVEECRAAQLRQEAMSNDCEEVLGEAAGGRPASVENTLLHVLGYDTSTTTAMLDSNQDLQDADSLAANAGSGQGVRAGEAAAIIASQRGGVPPAPPPR